MKLSPSAPTAPVDLDDLPGYHVRRLQQIAVAIFLQETDGSGLTPMQFATLQTASNQPDIDQRTLAGTIGLDTSTAAGVIDRLEARGLLSRSTSAHDRRVRLLNATAEGKELLTRVAPAMLRAQERILAPLSSQEQDEFMRMLRTLVTANNEWSRAPSEAG